MTIREYDLLTLRPNRLSQRFSIERLYDCFVSLNYGDGRSSTAAWQCVRDTGQLLYRNITGLLEAGALQPDICRAPSRASGVSDIGVLYPRWPARLFINSGGYLCDIGSSHPPPR
jgi:hypothetical protein